VPGANPSNQQRPKSSHHHQPSPSVINITAERGPWTDVVTYSNIQAAKPAAPAMGRPVILAAAPVDEGAPPEVSEPAWLVMLARVDETPEAALLAPEAREELERVSVVEVTKRGSTYVTPEASEARDEVTDARADEAEFSTLESALLTLDARLDASLARLDVALDAPLARLDVTLDASLARLDVALPALSVAEAKADDKTPRAPEEMAVADALADSAIASQGQQSTVNKDVPTHMRSKRSRTR